MIYDGDFRFTEFLVDQILNMIENLSLSLGLNSFVNVSKMLLMVSDVAYYNSTF